MSQILDTAKNVYVDLDQHGTVRQLLHTHAPVTIAAATPQLAAASYLTEFADLLGLAPAELGDLSTAPAATIEDAPVEYRFFKEKHQFDTTTMGYYQTKFGIPVWEAGLAVQLKTSPFRVLSSQSTRHPDLEVKKPSKDKAKRAESISEAELVRQLGLNAKARTGPAAESKSLKIEARSLVIYRYESAKRVPEAPVSRPVIGVAAQDQTAALAPHAPTTLPLPPVASSIQEGQHYVCARIDFALGGQPSGSLHWVALIEVESLSVLYLRAFIDDVNGMVFASDPLTANGSPAATANNAALNPVRISTALPGLTAPVSGVQSLTGDNVTLSDVESPTIAAPTEPSGTDFNFDARTDNFAAVNAYYHCDKFFRLLDSMGFTRSSFFGGTTFPSPVDHRGFSSTPQINAHCLGNATGKGIGQTTFALADLSDTTNPLGIACDYRVVLHELAGHGVLYNHVNSANFGFSHSAGDSVAAILNDPGTHAADRFQTFPWVFTAINPANGSDVGIKRRHDRTPAGGWGYGGNIGQNPFSGTYDSSGYQNEQILSSAHFRMYRSMGGDSADLAMQQFAARMAVYLIMRAIGNLTPATNPPGGAGAVGASAWETALETADAGDWVTENITGGAYKKLIRWAFEKQGLFQPAGTATPNNNEGNPPAVDVYIDDGRAGEYQFQPNWWSCQSIWNRLHSDGGTAHETPVTNQTNYAYVKIRNRGSQNATNVVVKAYHANPAAGLAYPIDWTPMNTAQLAAADVPANNAAEIVVGPFAWVPTHVGHECLFMIVSATGDASNVNNVAAGDSIPEWRLVPNDNNIGQRNVFPVAGSGTSGLTADFNRFTFQLKNPHLTTAAMEVRAILPSFLAQRGWQVQFLNRGGGSFPLAAGASMHMDIKLIPGADFSPADVAASTDKTIHLYGYAGGILVGGMSYEIDPNAKPPTGRGVHPPGHCAELGEELIRCVELSRQKVCRVRVRKVNVDLEIDGGCEACES